MVKLNPPFGGHQVDVPEQLVDRFLGGGWTKVGPSPTSPDKKKPVRGRKPVTKKD